MKGRFTFIFLSYVVSTFQMFSQAESSASALSAPATSSNINAGLTGGNPVIDNIISTVNSVEEKNNFIGQMLPDSLASLPIGIIKQIGATRYIIAIDSMNFKSQGAYFSACAAIDFPGTTKKLAYALFL